MVAFVGIGGLFVAALTTMAVTDRRSLLHCLRTRDARANIDQG